MMSVAAIAILLPGMYQGEKMDSTGGEQVAAVGRFVITTDDLVESYEAGPAFVKRLANPLRKHLEFMIDERLLALDAGRVHQDTTQFVRERVLAIEEDVSVDELYKDDILSHVKVTEEEIDVGMKKAKTNLRVRWLYAETKREGERLAQQLKRGVPFDSLFHAQKGEPGSRNLETTLLRLEFDRPEFASRISTLGVKDISPPLQGPDGYYIVRIDQIWQNPLSTESEFRTVRQETGEALRTAKAGRLAGEYVRTKMKSANPVIKGEGFNIIRAFLAERGLSRDARVKWDIPSTFMTEAGPLPLAASGKLLNRPLVTFAGQVLHVRDYVRWFDIRQFQLKRTSLATFNASVKQSIWKMVQDKLLSQEAYSRGLNTRQGVGHETAKWEAKLLYLSARAQLSRTITVADSALKGRFHRERKQYRGADGKQLSFEHARDAVWLDVYHDAENLLLFRILQQLRRKYEIVIDDQVLKRLEVQYPSDPDAIDVKFYKPGGTFPRVAFPSIDERWQWFTK